MKYVFSALAAVSLVAIGAHADPGNSNKGNGKAEHGPSMKGSGKPSGPSMASANRGSGATNMAASAHKGPPAKADKGPSMASAMKDERGPPAKASKDRSGNPAKGVGNAKSPAMAANRGVGPGASARGGAIEGVRVLADGRRVYDRHGVREWWGAYDQRPLIEGCPPGLAKKNNGCMPPGLAKDDPRYRYSSYRPDWWGLGGLLGGGRYLYDNGYLLHFDGNSIGGYVPLLGGALSIGNRWPGSYAPRPVPNYYVSYYDLGPPNGYRYADDVLYRVDPTTEAITSIAALLTGDDFRVGQPIPSGYDVYNVPYPYRSQYVDGPDASYRYSDGYVYQVDPKTRLIAAAIELLAS